MPRIESTVAEMQGLYGPFTLNERVLQRIWLHGDFSREGLRLTDGRSLELLSPGRWNLAGGPDFLAARLRVGGDTVTGDVEVHFQARDWTAHGHAANPAFAGVALHVVLFPPDPAEPVQRSAQGKSLPTLVLLPHLLRDLEEYASDDALETLTERDEWRRFEALAALPAAEVEALVIRQALARWRQKVHFARQRVRKLGWEEACHHTALEVLGYRRNRAGMLALAVRHPLAQWRAAAPGIETLLEEGRAYWVTAGQRPPNHPRVRLRQYQEWLAHCPDWPQRLQLTAKGLPGLAEIEPEAARRVRREVLSIWEERVVEPLLGGSMGGSRLDTLVCDSLLPLLAAGSGAELAGVWYHWRMGDTPEQVRMALRRLGLAAVPGRPFCHGLGQGLLGWILERQSRASHW
jgi:hypothetical protein